MGMLRGRRIGSGLRCIGISAQEPMQMGCRVGFYPTFGVGSVVEVRGVEPHPTDCFLISPHKVQMRNEHHNPFQESCMIKLVKFDWSA